MRVVVLSLAAAALMAAVGPAAAQSRLTCTGLYNRCLSYNAGYGPAEVKNCDDARKACMQSGNWNSRAFDYKNVRRQ
ncbi:MAG: hypothetical protein M3R18_04235 [Pseudomonadota bacterium]|nr:hypothetical protein [Pseudomonadota bacterium]